MSGGPDGVLAVVVYHSGAERLRSCLASLEAQDHPGLRVALVDHSPEGVPDDALAGSSRVRRIRPARNTGFGGGVAAALAVDSAPVVLWLNPDARAEPSWARRLATALEENPRAGMAAAPVRMGSDPERLDSAGLGVTRGGTGILRGHRRRLADWSPEKEHVPLLGPAGASAAFRRRAVEEAGGVPTAYFLYYEDLELAWRIRAAGWTCAWVNDPLAVHDHVSGAGADKLYYLQRARRLFLRRNWPAASGLGDRTARGTEETLSWLRAAASGRWDDARRARADARRLDAGSPPASGAPDRTLTAPTRHLFALALRRVR